MRNHNIIVMTVLNNAFLQTAFSYTYGNIQEKNLSYVMSVISAIDLDQTVLVTLVWNWYTVVMVKLDLQMRSNPVTTTKANLVLHMRTHTGEKTYQCENYVRKVCTERRFTQTFFNTYRRETIPMWCLLEKVFTKRWF